MSEPLIFSGTAITPDDAASRLLEMAVIEKKDAWVHVHVHGDLDTESGDTDYEIYFYVFPSQKDCNAWLETHPLS